MTNILKHILLLLTTFFGWHATYANDLNMTKSAAPIVIFISFSMPDASIKAILDDAAKIDAPVMIRGLIDHSFKKTLLRLYQITQQKHHHLQIDPETFKEYGVTSVPTVLIRNNEKYRLITGDVILEHVLLMAAHTKDELSSVAEESLVKLRAMNNA